MSDPEIIDLLATVPLFTGIERPDLAEFARIMRRRVFQEGEVLWRQGDEATEMLVMVDGHVCVTLQLPGERAVELASVGPGEAVGELALLDGGQRTASAHVTAAATMLSLGRPDLAALVSRRHASAFE